MCRDLSVGGDDDCEDNLSDSTASSRQSPERVRRAQIEWGHGQDPVGGCGFSAYSLETISLLESSFAAYQAGSALKGIMLDAGHGCEYLVDFVNMQQTRWATRRSRKVYRHLVFGSSRMGIGLDTLRDIEDKGSRLPTGLCTVDPLPVLLSIPMACSEARRTSGSKVSRSVSKEKPSGRSASKDKPSGKLQDCRGDRPKQLVTEPRQLHAPSSSGRRKDERSRGFNILAQLASICSVRAQTNTYK